MSNFKYSLYVFGVLDFMGATYRSSFNIKKDAVSACIWEGKDSEWDTGFSCEYHYSRPAYVINNETEKIVFKNTLFRHQEEQIRDSIKRHRK